MWREGLQQGIESKQTLGGGKKPLMGCIFRGMAAELAGGITRIHTSRLLCGGSVLHCAPACPSHVIILENIVQPHERRVTDRQSRLRSHEATKDESHVSKNSM